MVNNAIFMVDRINAAREQGMDVRYAAGWGSWDRLRPILITIALLFIAMKLQNTLVT